MLGIGFIISGIIDFIKYHSDPDNRLNRSQIKWLKEKKGLTDYEIKKEYLTKDIHGYIARLRIKKEYTKEVDNEKRDSSLP